MELINRLFNFRQFLWKATIEMIKSMSWFILTVLIGLCTTWIDWFVRCYNNGCCKFPTDDFISNGALLIVCITIVSSLLIDYMFIDNKSSNIIIKFLFSVFPAIWLFSAGVSYTLFLMSTDRDIEFIKWFELYFLLITILYAAFIRWYTWRYGKYICSLDSN